MCGKKAVHGYLGSNGLWTMTKSDDYPLISTLPFPFGRTLEEATILNKNSISTPPFQLLVDHVTKCEKSRSDGHCNVRALEWNLNSGSLACTPIFLFITLRARLFQVLAIKPQTEPARSLLSKNLPLQKGTVHHIYMTQG